MSEHNDGLFDEYIASSYDDDDEVFNPSAVEPVVAVLEKLAGEGGALEFGIGTGRIAAPLASRGIRIHGIDLSTAMMSRIQGKPGSELISTIKGDFSSTKVEGDFSVVFLIFNTIMNLTSQQAQVACFQNAANHLPPGGHFVIEVMMPRLQWLSPGERLMTWDHSADHWGMDEYDIATQSLVSHHMKVVEGKPELFDTPCRYVWPAELDLMAQLAGMRLVSRWEDWLGAVFTSESANHISVWQKK